MTQRNRDSGLSRRRRITNTVALAASSFAASSAGENKSEYKTLPKFDSPLTTNRIAANSIASDTDRFAAWNTTLRTYMPGRETAFVDLDAVDHNLKVVGQAFGSNIGLRLVAKSLPCLDLLKYMMVTAGTNRIMAFSEGMVRDLLLRFGDGVDILLGRPAAVHAAKRTLEHTRHTGRNVRWLVDTPERMTEFAELAASRRQTISVALEIDVGLRRGGARTEAELITMLRQIDTSPWLTFAGIMGYEGHIPFAAMGQLTPATEFARVQERYATIVDAGRNAFPDLFAGDVVLNSGGSRTYHLYGPGVDTPVNEVAMGSAFFYPSHFHNIPEQRLRAATFFATPILKRVEPAETPFDPNFLPALAKQDPRLQVANFMTTGDFPGSVTYPRELIKDPLNPDDATPPRLVNMLPNQGRWLSSRATQLEVGDFIFYQPWEADAIRWLRFVDVFRGKEVVGQWPTFQPGTQL